MNLNNVIVIIDDAHYYDIPILMMGDDAEYVMYLEDREALDTLIEAYEPGIYQMTVEETEDFEGQPGEYGGWEMPPCHYISKISMVKIGNVLDGYITESQKAGERLICLQQRMKTISTLVTEKMCEEGYDEYILRPHFGNTIIFGMKKGWLVKTLKSYPAKRTEENVSSIEHDVAHYFKEGYFDDCPGEEHLTHECDNPHY